MPDEWLAWQALDVTTTRNYYGNRDALGRFVRRVHVDELHTLGGWVNASADRHLAIPTTHAHERCGNIDPAAVVVPTDRADGWLCAACIEVPVPAFILARQALANRPPKGFVQECRGCGHILPAQKFPTYVDSGYRMRDTTCRACHQSALSVSMAA